MVNLAPEPSIEPLPSLITLVFPKARDLSLKGQKGVKF